MTGNKRQPGFSLIEMLVVALIFGIMSVTISQIFVSFNRLHRRVSDSAVLGQDMRFAMELIIREARNDAMDYGAAVLDKDTVLKMVKQNGQHIWIAKQSGANCDATVTSCLALSLDSGTTWTQITSSRVQVQNFDVYVRPTVNPFQLVGNSYPNNAQPMATIHLNLLYKSVNVKDQVSLEAQTTVSSRVYQR